MRDTMVPAYCSSSTSSRMESFADVSTR
jgi:hypothetical protein